MDYVTCKALNAGSDTVSCWTRSESSGMMLMVLADGASGVATLVVSASIVKRGFQTGRNPVKTRMDILMISLLFANLLHALAGLLNIKWIIQGYSDVGTFCTVQGVLNQVGPVAVAINTIAIAIWTFVTIWSFRGVKEHLRPMWYMILAIWLIVFIVTAAPLEIPKTGTPLLDPCTVLVYHRQGLRTCPSSREILWFWLAFLLSFILYLPLALLARGNLTRSRTARFGFTIHRRPNENRNQLEFVIYSMIAYPLSNAVLIIPLSVVRWIQLTGSRPISARDSIAVATIFDLNGLVNVLLLVYLRPGLFQGGEPAQTALPQATEPDSSPTASGSSPSTAARAIGKRMESARAQDEPRSVLDRSETGSIIVVPRVANNGDLEMVEMKSNNV